MARTRRHRLPTTPQCDTRGCKTPAAPQSRACHACRASDGACEVNGCDGDAHTGHNRCDACRTYGPIRYQSRWTAEMCNNPFCENPAPAPGQPCTTCAPMRTVGINGRIESVTVNGQMLPVSAPRRQTVTQWNDLIRPILTVPVESVTFRSNRPPSLEAMRGYQLEMMGGLFNVDQTPGETDDEFRARIFAAQTEYREVTDRNAEMFRRVTPPLIHGVQLGATQSRTRALVAQIRATMGATGTTYIMCGSEETAAQFREEFADEPGVRVEVCAPLVRGVPGIGFEASERPKETFAEWSARTAQELEWHTARLEGEALRADPLEADPLEGGDGADRTYTPDGTHARDLSELVGMVLDWGEQGIE